MDFIIGTIVLAAAVLTYFLFGKVKVGKSNLGILGFDYEVPDEINQIPSAITEKASVTGIIKQVCQSEGYRRVELALAIASQESSFNPNARNPEVTRKRGDQPDSIGLMGLQYATAKKFYPGIIENDLVDPLINATCGVRYLKYLSGKYEANSNYGLDAVIQMYNLGEPRYMSGSRALNYLVSVKKKAGYA